MYSHAGATKQSVEHPLLVRPVRRPMYFEPRRPFNLMAQLMNPMGLMMMFMLGMAVCMPRMMKNMDPAEMRQMQEEMEKRNSEMGDMSMSSLFGGKEKDSDDDE